MGPAQRRITVCRAASGTPRELARKAAMIALHCAAPATSAIILQSSGNAREAWRKHEEQDHRPLRLSRAAQGGGHHASVRQSRHHRIADHAWVKRTTLISPPL